MPSIVNNWLIVTTPSCSVNAALKSEKYLSLVPVLVSKIPSLVTKAQEITNLSAVTRNLDVILCKATSLTYN